MPCICYDAPFRGGWLIRLRDRDKEDVLNALAGATVVSAIPNLAESSS